MLHLHLRRRHRLTSISSSGRKCATPILTMTKPTFVPTLAALSTTADFLKRYPSIRATIEGHCDERGSTEYNLGLGDRRASAVKQYLVSLGVSADRLSTVSFGKEKPFCNEHNEACYQQNRRGHFVKAN